MRDYKEEILCLDKIAKKLRARRFKQGAIDFDRYEVKFDIDENGKPLSVYFKESKDSNKLIEEFMLLANKKVAESVGRVPKGKQLKPLFTEHMINPIHKSWKPSITLFTSSDLV